MERPVLEEIAAAHGIRPLSVGWAGAFVGDADERLRASRAILRPSTSAAGRRELIAKYHVAGALCETTSCRRIFAGPTLDVDGLTLVRLKSP